MTTAQRGGSIRLTLAWRKDGWTVTDRTDLPDKGAPASDDLPFVPAGVGMAGYSAELHDESGRVLYRHVGSNPFFAATQEGPRPLDPADVAVRIVVPELPTAALLVMWSPRPPQKGDVDPDAPADHTTTIDLRAEPATDERRRGTQKGGRRGRQ